MVRCNRMCHRQPTVTWKTCGTVKMYCVLAADRYVRRRRRRRRAPHHNHHSLAHNLQGKKHGLFLEGQISWIQLSNEHETKFVLCDFLNAMRISSNYSNLYLIYTLWPFCSVINFIFYRQSGALMHKCHANCIDFQKVIGTNPTYSIINRRCAWIPIIFVSLARLYCTIFSLFRMETS